MRDPETMQRHKPVMTRAVWAGTLLLVLIGVGASIHRGMFIPDAITRIDPVRTSLFDRWRIADPHRAERPAELARMDGRFADHPALTLFHVAAGALFLAFAPLQFITPIRNRHPRFHRITGRLLVLSAFVSVLPAFYFGIVVPYGGPVEAVAIGLFGVLFLFALVRAVVAIRAGRTAIHREWMIRAFALALAISTVRLLGPPADAIFTPLGFRPAPLFAATVWAGWLLTMGAAEWWIRRTRPSPAAAANRDTG